MTHSLSHLARRSLLLLALAAAFGRGASAQDKGAVRLDQLVRGLTVTPRVLVIAAHPDDENTQLIAYLARGKRVETAYLSLTRGDGGQNVIGNELGDALGAIRTEELLAARRVDGGHQYFTRAFDFGFSKSAEETLKHWPRDEVLADIVTVIRSFRPQVIYSVWSGTRADGHGHHELAGILAREAFDASMDTVKFPEKKYGYAWQASKFYRGAVVPGGRGATPASGGRGVATLGAAVTTATGAPPRLPVVLNVGEYDAVLGSTYGEIATDSRSQHRSQGFANISLRGGRGAPNPVAAAFIAALSAPQIAIGLAASHIGDANAPDASIFDGIDTTFARFRGSQYAGVANAFTMMQVFADSARAVVDLQRPETAVHYLAVVAQYADRARDAATSCNHPSVDFTANSVHRAGRCDAMALDLDAAIDVIKRRSAEALIAAAGIKISATTDRELIAYRDVAPVTVTVGNYGKDSVRLTDVLFAGSSAGLPIPSQTIQPGQTGGGSQFVGALVDPNPWWLGKKIQDMFPPAESPIDGLSRAGFIPALKVNSVAIPEDIRRNSDVMVRLTVAGATLTTSAGPIVFKSSDPLLGVQDRPIAGTPSVTLEFDRPLEWIPSGKPIDRLMRLTMRSYSDSVQAFTFKVIYPPGLKVDSLPKTVTLQPREMRETFVRIRGQLKEGRYEFAVAGIYNDSTSFYEGIQSIEYPHIRPLRIFHTSGIWLQAVDIELPRAMSVAYVQGAGDVMAPYLRQLGVPVTLIQPQDLPAWDLSRFSTVVVGTRAFEAHRELLAYVPRLMDFAKQGGTLVVQYEQQPQSAPSLFPFPLTFRGQPLQRVTEEDAPVSVLDPRARILTWPNAIGDKDWKGWVQERAVYMPSTIDPRYSTPLEMHDPGEPENKGAIVMTPLGKGMYIYTTLALFRQIPGAVPGGARLFVNLMSAGIPAEAPRRPVP